jgi:hypothetical protein
VLDGLWRDQAGGRVADRRLAYDLGWYELRVVGHDVAVRRLRESEHARIDLDAMLEIQITTAACEPSRPRRCWKSSHPAASSGGFDPTTSDEVVVWASTDGGETWTREVVLDAAAVDELREEAGEICGKPLRLNPGPLAVLETSDGPVVAVTVESAGVAVRGVDERWRWLPGSAIEDARRQAEPRDGARSRPDPSPIVDPRHPLRPVPPVTPAAWADEDADLQPTPAPSPRPPCDDPTLVTVTPDPRNGPASTQLRCPPSSSP